MSWDDLIWSPSPTRFQRGVSLGPSLSLSPSGSWHLIKTPLCWRECKMNPLKFQMTFGKAYTDTDDTVLRRNLTYKGNYINCSPS